VAEGEREERKKGEEKRVGKIIASPTGGEDYDEGEGKAKSPPHPFPLPQGEREERKKGRGRKSGKNNCFSHWGRRL